MVAKGSEIMGRQLYELIPEKGKHLADSHDTEGASRGVYLDDETNKPCGAGEFMPVEIDDEEGSGRADFAFAGILAIGIGIGVVANKAYPHVRKWITTTAFPKVKKFWRKVTKRESKPEQIIECDIAKITPVLMEPEEFSENIDLVINEFHANGNNEEAKQHLLNIMCAAMYIANEIRQLSNVILKDEDRLAWGVTLEKLTAQSVIDGINHILEEKVLTLDGAQAKALTECLGGILIVNGVFVPIENRRIKEALRVHPSDQREEKIL